MDINIPNIEVNEVGRVKEVRRGVIKITGLPSCLYGQFIKFPNAKGMIIEFSPREAVAIAIGNEESICVGDIASSQGELIAIPCGDEFIGRVVNCLAEPIDNKGPILTNDAFPIFAEAPGIMDREPLVDFFSTGIKIIDLTIPIGKGQRELIIGDRQTGKSSIGLDTIANQKDKNIICVYCWIGGPKATLRKHIETLRKSGALEYTIVVAAPAGISAAEQYLAPYTAATLGEYFMKKGKDVFVVFDDLTKHAWIYRQMSLLLERSSGREAYPGDIFYIHSQLLERAAKLRQDLGGGSMTFFPIVETLQGDITGYIQTNIISITDGQIYLDSNLFKEGFRPAIDLGLSVSRIGSRVQSPAIRQVSQGLRLEYVQYRELLRLTKMRTRLSSEVIAKRQRGETLVELFIQANNQLVSVEEGVMLFYAFQRKILEVVNPAMRLKFKENFFEYVKENNPNLIKNLSAFRELNPIITRELDEVLVGYFRKLKEEQDKNESAR